ncbi:tyrosine-type recombinase/integrase [Rhodoferax antarcticus]|uniref:tyrosine-type recombinase/integrase n=1 Tax=Rhodoferax antarcticus TaxID=81479 RepID=UPI002224F58C|nr:tyrosine-type recombinase/integrase [Rhodoferax antarcticus]MCW2312076.1 integrase [Rhodoferax antarcticus]
MLTDAQCRASKAREGIYRLNDYKGLYLEIKPNGIKAWRYRFKLNDKASWYALGDYPSVTLGDARVKCDAVRKQVKEGINPVQHRQIERIKRELDSANTFEAIAQEWLALKDWAVITKTRRLDMLKRVVFPSIGKLPVRQITSAHVLDIMNRTAKRGAPTVAAEAKRTISAVFGHAAATLRADTDPVWPVRNALPPNKTQHKRALSVEEVGKLLADFDGHGGNFQTIQAFRLMWLTLSRPNESIQAEWCEFDLEKTLWTIPAGRMKARREHVVPLPTQAVILLNAMHAITGHTKFVFPNRDDRQRPMSDAALRQALKKLGWATKYSPHGTRTTGSTRLNEMGYRPDAIETQLAHAEPNSVRRTYNHATYIEERRAMMQDWADKLTEWKRTAVEQGE